MKLKRVTENTSEALRHRRTLQRLLEEKPFLPAKTREALSYAIGVLDELLSDHDEGSVH